MSLCGCGGLSTGRAKADDLGGDKGSLHALHDSACASALVWGGASGTRGGAKGKEAAGGGKTRPRPVIY